MEETRRAANGNFGQPHLYRKTALYDRTLQFVGLP